MPLRRWLRSFDAFLSPATMRRMGWLGAALFFAGLFLKVTWELHEDSSLRLLDEQLLVFISKLRLSALNGSAVDITALGSATVLTLFTLVGTALLWLNEDRRGCLYLLTNGAGAGIGTQALKHLFTRERPDVVSRLVEVSGFSYPSGHSLAATSFYLSLMFLSWRYFRGLRARTVTLACTLALIAGVCFSRLYLGVHYPSDVVSGACLGASWTCLLTAWFSRPRQQDPAPAS